jgi:hypothetical protein
MDDRHFFADVDLPFHVWVREGPRWVLRDAKELQGQAGGGTARKGESPRRGTPRGAD